MSPTQPDQTVTPLVSVLNKLLIVLIFVAACAIYWGSAAWGNNTTSPDLAYFDHLAQAFLQGRLYLANPPDTHDLTRYQGNWYVPFSPMPALLLLPWIAWQGLEKTNTVLFSALLAAANVTLVYLILQVLSRQRLSRLGQRSNLWLTVLFGLGCVHWYMASIGSVWFVAQICTVTFVALATWIAISSGNPWLTGLALALAMAARPHIFLTWPLLLGLAIERRRVRESFSWVWLRHWSLASFVPLIIVGLLLLGYNVARFDHPLDFGYLTENVSPTLASDLRRYGQFHVRFMPRNVRAMALALPYWDAARRQFLPDPWGMSLFLTTPALIYLIKARRRSAFVIGAWIAVALLVIPLLTYYNTGWWQFGYRFSLDFMIPVMVLLAVAAGSKVSRIMQLLIVLGVIVNLYGIWWWYNP